MALDERVARLIMNGRGADSRVTRDDELRYSALTYDGLEDGLRRMYDGREAQLTAITPSGDVILDVDGKKAERPLSDFGYETIGEIYFYRPAPAMRMEFPSPHRSSQGISHRGLSKNGRNRTRT